MAGGQASFGVQTPGALSPREQPLPAALPVSPGPLSLPHLPSVPGGPAGGEGREARGVCPALPSPLAPSPRSPVPRIKWRKVDGSLSPQWATAEPTLQIPSVGFEDEGTYECEAENAKGRDTVQGRIIVQGTAGARGPAFPGPRGGRLGSPGLKPSAQSALGTGRKRLVLRPAHARAAERTEPVTMI